MVTVREQTSYISSPLRVHTDGFCGLKVGYAVTAMVEIVSLSTEASKHNSISYWKLIISCVVCSRCVSCVFSLYFQRLTILRGLSVNIMATLGLSVDLVA